MPKLSEKERKSSLIQATILGRVERLAGSSLDTNPYPQGSDQWIAFKEGWSRPLDSPITKLLQQGKKALAEFSETPDGYA
jgi:hypothetical protein